MRLQARTEKFAQVSQEVLGGFGDAETLSEAALLLQINIRVRLLQAVAVSESSRLALPSNPIRHRREWTLGIEKANVELCMTAREKGGLKRQLGRLQSDAWMFLRRWWR